MQKIAALLLSLFLLTACAVQSRIEANAIPFCDYADRIMFSSVSEISALETDTLRQIKVHNDRVKSICGR